MGCLAGDCADVTSVGHSADAAKGIKSVKTVLCAAVPALLSAIAPARAQAAAPAGCAMPATRNISDVYATLSQRAIAIVEHAAAGGWQRDSELRALVRPDAEFDLGSGDVGGPLG